MIGSSDDAKVTELLAPLRRLEPVQLARPRAERRRLRKPVLVVAALAAALAVTGAAIADGLGAFDGIAAAQHAQTSADKLDPETLAQLQQNCAAISFYTPECHLVLDSSRLIGRLPDGSNLYVVADTHGDLCNVDSSGLACGAGLTRSRPFTQNSLGQLLYGVAIDGVTSISFENDGREVSIPVENNGWFYEGASLEGIEALTAHFADGATVTVHS